MKLPFDSKGASLPVPQWLNTVLSAVFLLLLLHYVMAVPRLPVFWYDEAFMVEPAWHLGTTGKSISYILPEVPDNQPFGMNYPLFSLLMAGWIKLFGFNLLTIRLLPFVLTFCAGLVAVGALRRMDVVRGKAQILLLLILWMLTQPAFYASHQARPESLTMLLAAAGLYTCTFGIRTGALIALFLLAALMPYCGLYMVFPAASAVVVALAVRTFHMRQALSVILGLFVGAVSFYVIYQWAGAWQSFQLVAATVGGLSLADRLSRILDTGKLSVTLIQQSVYWLFLVVLCWSWRLRKKSPSCWPLLLATAGYVAATVLSIGILANFSVWYGWLCLMPLMVGFVVFAFDCCALNAWIRGGIMVLLMLLLLDNHKARYLSSSHLLFWHESASDSVEASLKGVVNKDDVVIGSESAYIALRPNVKKFYSLVYCSYLMEQSKPINQIIPQASADSISVIVADVTKLHSGLAQSLQQWCGGEWEEIRIPYRPKPVLPKWLSFLPAGAEYFECCNYRVFRRVSRNHTP